MQEFGKPAIERRAASRLVPRRISTLVLLMTLVLIAIAGASLVHVGRIASREADAQARANDIRLFSNALHDRQILMAREQLALARWTKSYRNITQKFSQSYVRRELVDYIWSDYGHNRSYLVAPGDQILMAAHQDRPDFTARQLPASDPVAMVARRAGARFLDNREPMPGGFRQKHVTPAKVAEVTEFAFAMLDGEPALVSAMAIVPDEDGKIAMPDGPPVVLVSAKFLRHELGRELNAQLAFSDFAFEPGAGHAASGLPTLQASDGSVLGTFRWTSERPGAKIWPVVIPVIAMLAALLALAAGLIARAIGRISTRLEASEAKSRQLALHDALTGLANRLNFTRSLDAAVARLPHLPFAVLACDLDRFKAVNDTFGHAGGDTVIRAVAQRLAAAVGSAGLVGRTGGDEFVILVSGFTDRPRLTVLTHQIIASVCDPVTLDDGAVTDVGISLGVAVAPDHAGTAAAIMAAADGALYVAKERGRGIAVFARDSEAAEPPKTAKAPHAA